MKNLIVESMYEGGLGFSNETSYFTPVELKVCSRFEHDMGVVIDYEVPEGTEIYMFEEENIYEDRFTWSLRKYDWSAEKWKRMDGASAVYDDPDYSTVKWSYYATSEWLGQAGLICH